MSVSKKAYRLVKKVQTGVPYRIFNGHAFRPLKVTFEVTYRCNLECDMCYLVHEGRERGGKELTVDEIKNVISQFTRKIPVTFTGGEPLIKEGIMDVLRYASKRNACSILTNGIMLNEERSKEIVDMGVSSITISVDGPKNVHNKIRGPRSFEGAVEGIRKVQEYKKKLGKNSPKVHLNTVILPSNIESLHEIVDLAVELSIGNCSFQILDPSLDRSGLNLHNELGRCMKPTIHLVDKIDPKKIERFLNNVDRVSKNKKTNVKFVPPFNRNDLTDYYSGRVSLNKYICKLPWSSMRISPFGDVYPCFNYRIGNVRKDTISNLWNNFYYKKFRSLLKKHKIFPGCAGCCNMIYR